MTTPTETPRRTGNLLTGGAALLMALCCVAAPAVLGAIAGAVIGNALGIAAAVVVAALVAVGGSSSQPSNRATMLTARRRLLVGLLVASTALFVVGVSLERSSADTHTETATSHESEGAHVESSGEHTPGAEDARLLGVDAEAWPLVALIAAISLALAIGTSLRPQSGALLVLIAAAMLAFAAFDVREVVHQLDENRNGLALLAALVAALHLTAAAIAPAPSTFAR